MIENESLRVYTTIMRGGTSKGIFLKENDLPQDPEMRDKVILSIFGSPDPRQIDGIGGAEILTSKLAIIGAPSREDADVDYTFGQVEINLPRIHYTGLCGNISSAVGTYAIEEGLVKAVEPVTRVRIHSKNTNQIYIAEVPVQNNRPNVEGNYRIDGVPGEGAEVVLNMAGTVGSVTGKLLPTGNLIDNITLNGRSIEVSVIDMVNPVMYVNAADFGLRGDETPEEFNANHSLVREVEQVRSIVAEMLGLQGWKNEETTPFLVFVSKRKSYRNYLTGENVNQEDVDLLARMILMGKMHKTYAGSVSCNTGIAAVLKGSLVNRAAEAQENAMTVRIGHPSGAVSVQSAVEGYGSDAHVIRATYSRTCRRLMDGYAYIRKSTINKD